MSLSKIDPKVQTLMMLYRNSSSVSAPFPDYSCDMTELVDLRARPMSHTNERKTPRRRSDSSTVLMPMVRQYRYRSHSTTPLNSSQDSLSG